MANGRCAAVLFTLMAAAPTHAEQGVVSKPTSLLQPQVKPVWSKMVEKYPSAFTSDGNRLYWEEDSSVVASDERADHVWTSKAADIAAGIPGLQTSSNIRLTEMTVSQGVIYVGVSNTSVGCVAALDASTGKLLWKYVSVSLTLMIPSDSRGAILTPPVVAGDLVLARTNCGMTAVRKADGQEVWNTLLDRPDLWTSTPDVKPCWDSKTIFLSAASGMVYAVRLSDGQLVWKRPTSSLKFTKTKSLRGVKITIGTCHPFISGDAVFVGNGVGDISALSKSSGEILWTTNVVYPYQLQFENKELLAATATGFYKLDAATGRKIAQIPNSKGFTKFMVHGRQLLLIRSPHEQIGWDIIDVASFKRVNGADRWSTYGVAEIGDGVVVVGYDPVAANNHQPHYSIESYVSVWR
jgi:outer membrane protein assembly factor BamB